MIITKHIVFVLLALLFENCGADYHKRNQEQPLVSPSGKYILTVPIETVADKHRYWRVTISDVNGSVLFKDDSEFVGNLNVYWSWDNHDRVWLKNSDNGHTYYWELDNNNVWRRYRWEQGNLISPPASLSPGAVMFLNQGLVP